MNLTRLPRALGLVTAAVVAAAIPAEARITRIEFTRVESPGFGGKTFGHVGTFDKLVGTAYGEVDPSHPLNRIIQDIELAPRNARGMVEYSTDLYIIKPTEMRKGNRLLFYNVNNRGNKGGLGSFNIGVVGGNEPTDLGDGFLQRLGYTLIWSGWQADVLPGNARLTMTVPVARNPDGSQIEGVVRSELITATPAPWLNLSSGRFTGLTHDSYPTVSTDNQTPLPDGFLPTLTVREKEFEPRVPIPNSEWAFGTCTADGVITPTDKQICLRGGFQPGKIYELIYRGTDPWVIGLGYAAMRDLAAFFKHEREDDARRANPLWLDGKRPQAVFSGSSQSGRNMRTFIHLGFNEDEEGRIAYEGAFPHIGGGRAAFNIRFGQPGRAWGHYPDRMYPAYEFPFAYQPLYDPVTDQSGGVLSRCLETRTCPRIFHVATALEIWEGRQSLGLTDPLARYDLKDGPLVRNYIMASTQHGSAPTPPPFGECQQQTNPNPQLETMRALWVNFTWWVKYGVPPPRSEVPRLRDRTLVRPEQVRFPSIPANSYGGVSRPAVKWLALANQLDVLDFGPEFDEYDESGIPTEEPPRVVVENAYGVRVPQVDRDGNDLAGIRSTAILAPIGTYTGWNLQAAPRFEDQMCSLQGSFIPFARTRAERLAVGDPRLSLEERYRTHAGYVRAVRRAAHRLVWERFLLPEDAVRLVEQAEASDILR
jgi:hypothetical protein